MKDSLQILGLHENFMMENSIIWWGTMLELYITFNKTYHITKMDAMEND